MNKALERAMQIMRMRDNICKTPWKLSFWEQAQKLPAEFYAGFMDDLLEKVLVIEPDKRAFLEEAQRLENVSMHMYKNAAQTLIVYVIHIVDESTYDAIEDWMLSYIDNAITQGAL